MTQINGVAIALMKMALALLKRDGVNGPANQLQRAIDSAARFARAEQRDRSGDAAAGSERT